MPFGSWAPFDALAIGLALPQVANQRGPSAIDSCLDQPGGQRQ
jgi:hypothetical protein